MTKKNKKGKKVGEVVVAQNNVEVVVVADPVETIINIEQKKATPELPEIQKPKEATEKIATPVPNETLPPTTDCNDLTADVSLKNDKKKKNKNNKKKAGNAVNEKNAEEKSNETIRVIETLPNGATICQMVSDDIPKTTESAKKKKNKNNKNKKKTEEETKTESIAAEVAPKAEPIVKPVAPVGAAAQKKNKNKKNKANTNATASENQGEAKEPSLTDLLAEEIKCQLANEQKPVLKEKLEIPSTPPSSPVNSKASGNKKNAKKEQNKGKLPLNTESEEELIKVEETKITESDEGGFEPVKSKKSNKRKAQDDKPTDKPKIQTSNDVKLQETLVAEVNSVTVEKPKEAQPKLEQSAPVVQKEVKPELVKNEPKKGIEKVSAPVLQEAKPEASPLPEEAKPAAIETNKKASPDADKCKKVQNKKNQQKKSVEVLQKEIAVADCKTPVGTSAVPKPLVSEEKSKIEVQQSVGIEVPKLAPVVQTALLKEEIEPVVPTPIIEKPQLIEVKAETTSAAKQEKKPQQQHQNKQQNKKSKEDSKPNVPVAKAAEVKPEIQARINEVPVASVPTLPSVPETPVAEIPKPKESTPAPKEEKKPQQQNQNQQQNKKINTDSKAVAKAEEIKEKTNEVKTVSPVVTSTTPVAPVVEKPKLIEVKVEPTKEPTPTPKDEKKPQQQHQNKQQNKKNHTDSKPNVPVAKSEKVKPEITTPTTSVAAVVEQPKPIEVKVEPISPPKEEKKPQQQHQNKQQNKKNHTDSKPNVPVAKSEEVKPEITTPTTPVAPVVEQPKPIEVKVEPIPPPTEEKKPQQQQQNKQQNKKNHTDSEPNLPVAKSPEITAKSNEVKAVSPIVNPTTPVTPVVEKPEPIEVKLEPTPTPKEEKKPQQQHQNKQPVAKVEEVKAKVNEVSPPATLPAAPQTSVVEKKIEIITKEEIKVIASPPLVVAEIKPKPIEVVEEKPAKPSTPTLPKQNKQQNKKDNKKGPNQSHSTKKENETIKVETMTQEPPLVVSTVVKEKVTPAAPQLIVEKKEEQPPVVPNKTVEVTSTPTKVEENVCATEKKPNTFITDVFPSPAQISPGKNKKANKQGPPSYAAIAQLPSSESPTELPLESSDDESNLQQIKLESERILKQTLHVAEGKVAEIQKNSDTLSESMKKLEEKVADIKKGVAQENAKVAEEKAAAAAQQTLPTAALPKLSATLKAAENKMAQINNILSAKPSVDAALPTPLSQVDENSNSITTAPLLPPRASTIKDEAKSISSTSSKNVEKSGFALSVENSESGVKSLDTQVSKESPNNEPPKNQMPEEMAAPTKPVPTPKGPTTKGKGAAKPANNKNVSSSVPAASKKPEVPPKPANLKPSPSVTMAKSQPATKNSPPTTKASSPAPITKASSPAPIKKASSPARTTKASSPAPFAKSSSPALPAKSASPAPPKSATPPATAKAQSPAPSAEKPKPATKSSNGPKPTANGAVKKPDVPPKPEHLKASANKTGATAKKSSPKTAAKEFDSRLQQQDTANKILAFIKTLSSHPSDSSASINSFPYPSNIGQLEQESIAQADPDNLKPDFASKLLDLFLEVNDRLKVKEKEDNLDDNMKALLTKDKIHLMQNESILNLSKSTDQTGAAATPPIIVASNKSKNQHPAKKVNISGDEKSTEQMMGSSQYIQDLINAPMPSIECDSDDLDELDGLDEEEEFIEFRFAPREVFIATTCFVCKSSLKVYFSCEQCQMISYCSEQHRQLDAINHKPICCSIQFIAKKRGGHCYHMSKKLNHQEFRNIRVYTLSLIEQDLQRPLQAFEREILLFPRLCAANICREWKQNMLKDCEKCGHISFCPDHCPDSHKQWCRQFSLYHKLTKVQKELGKIDPVQPTKIIKTPTALPATMDEMFKLLYKNSAASLKDECLYTTMTQIATVPLTALLGLFQSYETIPETFTIHLIGAELQFEGECIEKWETFFLHFVPQIVELRVIFIGPEFNNENLPLDVISRIRMCRHCRQKSPPRAVKFDFQCQTFYHDFANSAAYTKPDLICFFNPGLHRHTGFSNYDTWPRTIKSATATKQPIIVTAYTKLEVPLDLERLDQESDRTLTIVQEPILNRFSSQRPERNFISDELSPMIFKNYYYFVVK